MVAWIACSGQAQAEEAPRTAMIEIDPQTWLEQQQGRSESSFSSRTAPAQLIGVHEALAQQDMPQLILSGLLIQSPERDSATAILPEYSSITYTQSELSVQLRTDGSLVTVWKGSHSTQEPNGNIVLGVATLVQQPNGDIFANFGTETSAFNLLKLSSLSEVGEYYQIQETRWSDIGNESDEEATMDTEDTSGRSDPGQEPAEPSPTVFLAGSTTVPGTVETFTAVKDSSVSPITTADSSNRNRQRLRKRRDLQDTSNPEITIDVLVVVTFRAMCESSGQNDLNTCQLNDSSRSSMEGKLAVTVAETNTDLHQGCDLDASLDRINWTICFTWSPSPISNSRSASSSTSHCNFPFKFKSSDSVFCK